MNKHAIDLASKGRFGDTILAHINPSEALLLKLAGGSGTINPKTGLPEFFSFGDIWGGISSIVSAPAQWTADALHNITGGGDFEKISDQIKDRNDAGFSGMLDTIADPTGTTNYIAGQTGQIMPEWIKSGVDTIAPIAGGIVGGIYGGPWGAAGGAAAGSGLAGKLRGKSYSEQMQDAGLSAALAYGGGKLLQGANVGSSTIPTAGEAALSETGDLSAILSDMGANTDFNAAIGGGLSGTEGMLPNSSAPGADSPIWQQAAGYDTAPAIEAGATQPNQPGIIDMLKDKASGIFSSSAASSGGAGAGSAGANTGGVMNMLGNNKMLAALLASGLYSSYATGKENAGIAEANRDALTSAINKESWNPESRTMNSNAIESTINTAIEAQRKRSGDAGAETGRGGGFYGNEMERARRAGNEFRATEMAKTYAPNPNLIPYLAQAGGASPSATSGLTAGLGQTSGNILPYLLAMQMMGKS